MKIAKKIVGWIGIAIMVIAIGLAGFMLIGPRFGWETCAVMSNSMEPALRVGGIVVTKPVKLEDVKIGDIITFQIGERKVGHRVVDIIEQEGKPWFQTKGDANKKPDPIFVSSKGEEMRKVVFHLPYAGFGAVFMKSKLVFRVLVGILALLLVAWLGKDIYKAILEEKEKRRVKATNQGDKKE